MSQRSPGAVHLECTATGTLYESERLQGLSDVGKPLFARYDLDALRDRFTTETPKGRDPDMWRYAEVLPVRDPSCRVRLGEGFTPLIDAPRIAVRSP